MAEQPDVVIATPGRLIDHVKRRTVNLTKWNSSSRISGHMLDLGFLPNWSDRRYSLRPPHHIFSATFARDEELAPTIFESRSESITSRQETQRSGSTPAYSAPPDKRSFDGILHQNWEHSVSPDAKSTLNGFSYLEREGPPLLDSL